MIHICLLMINGGCKGIAYMEARLTQLLDTFEICHELWNSLDGKYSNTESIFTDSLHQMEMYESVTHRDRSESQI